MIMKAIVCDYCGNTILIPDELGWYGKEAGVYRICSNTDARLEADLCKECFDKLLAAVRKEKDNG
jgi:hypothetical protein